MSFLEKRYDPALRQDEIALPQYPSVQWDNPTGQWLAPVSKLEQFGVELPWKRVERKGWDDPLAYANPTPTVVILAKRRRWFVMDNSGPRPRRQFIDPKHISSTHGARSYVELLCLIVGAEEQGLFRFSASGMATAPLWSGLTAINVALRKIKVQPPLFFWKLQLSAGALRKVKLGGQYTEILIEHPSEKTTTDEIKAWFEAHYVGDGMVDFVQSTYGDEILDFINLPESASGDEASEAGEEDEEFGASGASEPSASSTPFAEPATRVDRAVVVQALLGEWKPNTAFDQAVAWALTQRGFVERLGVANKPANQQIEAVRDTVKIVYGILSDNGKPTLKDFAEAWVEYVFNEEPHF